MRSGIGIVFLHGSRQGRCIKIATATPEGVAVFTTGYANVGSPCVCLHRMALFIGNRGSSSAPHDLVSIVGGALERIFQTLRDQIDHHLSPSSMDEDSIRQGRVGLRHSRDSMSTFPQRRRDTQVLRLCLSPGGHIAPSNRRISARGSIQMEICGAF